MLILNLVSKFRNTGLRRRLFVAHTFLLPPLLCAGALTATQHAQAQSGNTLLHVHAHPDDEGIFGGGLLPYYSQVNPKNIVSLGLVTRNANGFNPLQGGGNSRVTELQNALQVYSGAATTTTNPDGSVTAGNITFVQAGLIDTGCCGSSPEDSWSDSGDGHGWGASSGVTQVTPGFGNLYGISDGRYAAAYTIAHAIRLYQPDVIVTPHDLEGDYGHSNHTAAAIGVIDAFTLAADASVDIEGLDPWQAKKLYLRGDTNDNDTDWDLPGTSNDFVSTGGINSLFHDGFEDESIGGLSPREVAELGLAEHVSQGGDALPVSTIYATGETSASGATNFDGHHSEWWTLYASTVGPDSLEPAFTIPGDTTNTTYVDFARGDFFQNVPEPGSLLLFSAGTLLFGRRRAR